MKTTYREELRVSEVGTTTNQTCTSIPVRASVGHPRHKAPNSHGHGWLRGRARIQTDPALAPATPTGSPQLEKSAPEADSWFPAFSTQIKARGRNQAMASGATSFSSVDGVPQMRKWGLMGHVPDAVLDRRAQGGHAHRLDLGRGGSQRAEPSPVP